MKTLIDFFCGAGGMGLGFKNAGFNIIQALDFDKYAVESYRVNVGDHVQKVDIYDVRGRDIKPADVWAFGFSCKDITKMGAQAGITGERSRTFFEVMRLLKETAHKPKVLLAENVDGLDAFFPIIEQYFNENGYKMQYKLICSADYGVPQARNRWFIVGTLNGDFVYPEVNKTDCRLGSILENNVDEKYYMKEMPEFIDPFMDEVKLKVIGRLSHKGPDVTKRVYSVHGLAPTLTSSEGGHRQPKIICPATGRVRKLTPREYARLQGFPDSFQLIVSDFQLYRQFGNAVTINVAEAVANSIKQYLGSVENYEQATGF